MKRLTIWHFLFIVILLLAAMNCQLVSKIGETKATVESVATQAKGGIEMVGTARALVTIVGSSGMLQTAQAIATEVGDSGFLSTAQAVATLEGPGLKETAESAIGEPPEDIPIMEGEKDDFLTGEFMVSYAVSASLKEVTTFYQEEMPANGWDEVNDGSLASESLVVLKYEKADRSATVTLNTHPLNNQTIVVILVTGQ